MPVFSALSFPGGTLHSRISNRGKAMNILLLTQIGPYPPDSGPKVKTYYLLRYLASRHRVTLVCLDRKSTRLNSSHCA